MIDLDGSQYPVKRLGDFARVSVLTSARGEFFRDVFESSLGSGGALGPGRDFFQGDVVGVLKAHCGSAFRLS